jgi:multidrug efflux pump subunit AcrA (membrane-fusion protein)
MNKKQIWFLIFLAMCSLAVSACGGNGRNAPTPTPVPALINYDSAIYTVERGPIREEQNLVGQVFPAIQDDLFFRSSGFVTRVLFKEGERFKKGDLLAELQVDDLLNQLEQARIDLEVAQANLANYNAQREYDLQKAESEVNIWKKRLELAQLDLESSSGSNEERARINLEITQENLNLAENALQLLQGNVNPYIQQAVTRSELAVKRLESLIQERQIFAPYDGVVLRSNIRPGQQVDAFENIFTVGDPTEQVIAVPFDFNLSTFLNEDTQVKFYFDSNDTQGYPVKYLPNFELARGTETVSETSRAENLYFSLPEGIPPEDSPINRNFILKVLLGEKQDALLLPPAAIREYKGVNFVIVLEGDRRQRVEIYQIGLRTPERWEVIGDLEEGDQVIGP